MADQEETDTPDAEPPRRSFRWRIIPGTLLLLFGAIGSLGMVLMAVTAVSLYLKYGSVSPSPDTPALNEVLLTPLNILAWQCGCWSCVAALVASWAWFRGQWRIAWAGTAGWLVLYGALAGLQSWSRYGIG